MNDEQAQTCQRAVALVMKSLNNSVERERTVSVLRDNPELAILFIQDIERQQAVAILNEKVLHPIDRQQAIDNAKNDPAFAAQIVQAHEQQQPQAKGCTLF